MRNLLFLTVAIATAIVAVGCGPSDEELAKRVVPPYTGKPPKGSPAAGQANSPGGAMKDAGQASE